MNDLELFKDIVRATTGVAAENVGKAVAKVREILGASSSQELGTSRKAIGTKNRQYLGGMDRSGGDE